MEDTFLDMAADCSVPVLSGTHLFVLFVCPRDISTPSLFSPSQCLVSPTEVLPRSIMQGQRPSGTRRAVCTQILPRQLYSRTHNARLRYAINVRAP